MFFYRLLIDTSWSMVFLIAFLALSICVICRQKKSYLMLHQILQENKDDPEKIIDVVEQYVKSHPFATANSTLRLSLIPLLILNNKTEKLQLCIKKIRVIDVSLDAADTYLLSVFLLKEYGYGEEFEMLLRKGENGYKPFQNDVYRALLNDPVDMDRLSNNSYLNMSDMVQSIVAYYRGLNQWNCGEYEKAAEQFELCGCLVPNMRNLLEWKGYAE